MVGVFQSRKRRAIRGYIMVATALSLPFLLGVTGLAIDIGRMYITKDEAQAFADSAALRAAQAVGRDHGGRDQGHHGGQQR